MAVATHQLLVQIQQGNIKALATAISYIENEANNYIELLKNLPAIHTPIIGITGPPGAGKSTLTDALIEYIVKANKKVAILCVDPSSPFNKGALLGDRVRMSQWYNHPNVYIRSLASRGSLGGLHPKILDISHLLSCLYFDYVIIETVGVGQSEIEIAGIANCCMVVLVPEAGDEIQTMKAGIMEIADMFVVNKSDRPEAHIFTRNLKNMLAPAFSKTQKEIPIFNTVAAQQKGIDAVFNFIENNINTQSTNQKHLYFTAQKAYNLIVQYKMKDIDKNVLLKEIEKAYSQNNFNLYSFIEKFI